MRRRRGRTRRGPGARVRVCGGACREPVPWGTEVLGARLAGRTSVLQWNTALAVTRPSWVGVSHFQNATSSGMANALTFCLVSKLNTCRDGGQGTATLSSRASFAQRATSLGVAPAAGPPGCLAAPP